MSENPNYSKVCPIWGTMAAYPRPPSDDLIFYDSPRTGGKFSMIRITESYINEIRKTGYKEIPINMNPRKMLTRIDVAVKARLTSCLIEKRYLGEEFPEVTYHLIQRARRRRFLTIGEKVDNFLIYLEEIENYSQFQCPDYREDLGYFLRSLAYIESKYDKDQENDGQKEINDCLAKMDRKGWTQIISSQSSVAPIRRLTTYGYNRLEQLNYTISPR